MLQVFGRLADRSTLAQAQAEVASIAVRLLHEYPGTNQNTGAVVAAFPSHFAPDRILIVLMSAVGFVLLVGCINVANLLLARSVGRSRELSIRVSLGATRWRIVRQLLVESGLLALAAGTMGVGFALAGVWLFANAVTGITFPYYIQWTIDGRVGVFVAAVCLGTAFLVGLLPAVKVSQLVANRSLKEGEKTATSGVARRRLTTALLTVELSSFQGGREGCRAKSDEERTIWCFARLRLDRGRAGCEMNWAVSSAKNQVPHVAIVVVRRL